MNLSGNPVPITLILISLTFSTSSSADEGRSGHSGVLNQNPYSSNQFPDNSIVIQTERHGRGTFSSYPSYQPRYRPANQRNKYRRPSRNSKIYTSPQPSVSYYYATPIGNSGHLQIQSRQGIYNNQQGGKHYPHSRPAASPHIYNVTPNNNFTYFQQYHSQPYYVEPQYRQHRQHNVDRRPTSCLGPDCGK